MTLEGTVVGAAQLGRLEDLGAALEALRKRSGLPVEQVALGCRQLGVKVSTELVLGWEGGVVLPSVTELVAALVVVGASPASLFVEVERLAWREALARDAKAVEVVLAWWRHAPLEQLLVLLAGRLEGVRPERMREQVIALGERLGAEPSALATLLAEVLGERR